MDYIIHESQTLQVLIWTLLLLPLAFNRNSFLPVNVFILIFAISNSTTSVGSWETLQQVPNGVLGKLSR